MVSMMNNINIYIIYDCNSPKERVHCLHVGNKFYPINNMATIVGHVFTFSLEKENIDGIVTENSIYKIQLSEAIAIQQFTQFNLYKPNCK